MVQGCLHHRILRLPFLLHGDDSAIAGCLQAPQATSRHLQVVSSGGLLRSAGSLPLVIIRAKQAPSRESSVRGVDPGLGRGDVVVAGDGVPLLPVAERRLLVGVDVRLVLVLHQHQLECRLVVDGLVQANVDHKCRNSIVSVIESEINPS